MTGYEGAIGSIDQACVSVHIQQPTEVRDKALKHEADALHAACDCKMLTHGLWVIEETCGDLLALRLP